MATYARLEQRYIAAKLNFGGGVILTARTR